MGMGILHSMNSTILQLNHLHVIRLSGGGAIWLPALKKIFLKPRVIFPFFLPFLQLSDLKEVVVETEAVKPSWHVRTISLLFFYILQAELRELQWSCRVPPNPVSRGRSLLLSLNLPFWLLHLTCGPQILPTHLTLLRKGTASSPRIGKWRVESVYWHLRPDLYICKWWHLGESAFLFLRVLFSQIGTIVPRVPIL